MAVASQYHIGTALMRAFGIPSSTEDRIVMGFDLHVDAKGADLNVRYLIKTPDLSEVAEYFRIVPKDDEALMDKLDEFDRLRGSSYEHRGFGPKED
jgi:hypothetical protein